MIVLFSIANFRSFNAEETFSMVADKRLSSNHLTHVISVPDVTAHILRTSVLYGANGAGKSNLFKALRYLKEIVLNTRKKNNDTGRENFRFAENTSARPTRFDLQFIAQDKLYRFTCAVTDKYITEESLVLVIGQQEKVLYERIRNEDGKVIIETDDKNVSDKFAALVTVGGPHNQTFLATIRANLDEDDYGEEISSVLAWFEESLTLIAPNEPFAPVGTMLARDSAFREFAGTFLKASATGVDAIKTQKQEITEETLRNLLPESVISRLFNGMNDEKGKTSVTLGSGTDEEFLIERSDKNHYYRLTVQADHKHQTEQSVRLNFSEESDGTRRLLNLIPALHHSHNRNAVYFIDEIDRSMHPMLAWKFLDFFLKSRTDEQRQIIVTTHESNLLDSDLLRRDEIWFADKDPDGATHLYSLSEFKPREDSDIRKHYLQGRFSAIPFLGNLEQLLKETK
ncbi:ATP/GTP-binding protein [Desulfobacterales bacterium HSG2]|nr:ATP/GTP-binding protein [Desulfobacterales bacterium HSG2]